MKKPSISQFSNFNPRLLLALAVCTLGALIANPAFATNRTVTNLNDSGAGSLRDTIAASASSDSIDFSVTGTITLTSGELLIARDLTITGPSGGITVSSSSTSTNVFHISHGN